MADVVLDSVSNVLADSSKFGNELQSLHMLKIGLLNLANSIRRRESRFDEIARVAKFSVFGANSDEEALDLAMVGCMFHWFGVSLCNYARLVGYIRAIGSGDFTRGALTRHPDARRLAKSVGDYVSTIPELSEVLIWRNKVAGHFAITDPRKEDNIATLDLSVMHPVTLESGTYFVGGWTLTRTGHSGSHTSDLPRWSLTQVFEAVRPRFWPDIERDGQRDASNVAAP